MRREMEKPKTQNRRLEQVGSATPGQTHGLTGMGQGVARQYAAGRVFGRFWNQTKLGFRSEPVLLASHPDPLLTLHIPSTRVQNPILSLLIIHIIPSCQIYVAIDN